VACGSSTPLSVEAGQRGEHAEGVRREEENDVGVAGPPRRDGPGDEVDRIAGPGVLGEVGAGEVYLPGVGVYPDVLDHRPVAYGLPDLRLLLAGEVDPLGVAAALEVEDALVRPGVLVVPDEVPLRVGREGRLAGAGKAEEEGHVAPWAGVGRAVHGKDALTGEEVVHVAEDGFLDFAAVEGAPDDDGPVLEADDEGLGVGAVDGGVGLDSGGDQDGEVRFRPVELPLLRSDQEVVGEEAVPGLVGRHPDAEAVARVAADEPVEDEALGYAGQVVLDAAPQAPVVLGGDGAVHPAPVDVVADGGVVNDEPVVRRPAGVLARGHGQGPGTGEDALFPKQGLLDEHGDGKVPSSLSSFIYSRSTCLLCGHAFRPKDPGRTVRTSAPQG
jgi:hypothetical protein